VSLQPAAAGWRDDAALTAFGVVLGIVAAVVAAEHYRDRPAYAPPIAMTAIITPTPMGGTIAIGMNMGGFTTSGKKRLTRVSD
jgi:hypothetical protein